MTSIAFSGDISFSKYFLGCEEKENLLDDGLCSFLSSADYTVLNVECALTDKTATVKGTDPAHASSPKCVGWLQKLGGNVWNLANNHTLDCGLEGIQDTMSLARQAGAQTLGVGETLEQAAKPLILSGAGGIGLVAVCYKKKYVADENKPGFVHWEDFSRIQAMIREVKSKCRWCIVVAHAGSEFTSLPMPNTRKNYLRYLRMGADIVVGHHPHVPQNYERRGKKTIFYSLGNCLFDTDYQRLQAHTDKGVLLKLYLDEKEYTFEAMGLRIHRTTHMVEQAELPLVFRALSSGAYRRLRPLVLRAFFKHIQRARMYLDVKTKDFTKEQWDAWFDRNKGKKNCKKWRKEVRRLEKKGCRCKDAELINYLNEDVE